ncbi:MAG: helix-turn-helix transcriptional regulator [Planctomycetes bacterium]|nr:helix-turn-helix transcriptional regulator [Planctomycetota bacterium]
MTMTAEESEQVRVIAANIAYLISLRGWSWNRLSAETGIAQSTVSRLKNARFEPGVFTMRKIAGALNTSIEWLCQIHEMQPVS